MRRAPSIQGWRAPELLRLVVSVPPLFATFWVSVFIIGNGVPAQYEVYNTWLYGILSVCVPLLFVSLAASPHLVMSLVTAPGEFDA